MNKELKEMWNACVEIIKDNITPSQFDTWFSCIEPKSYDGQQLIITVPSHFVYEQLEANYCDLLAKVIARVYGKGTKLAYSIQEIQHKSEINKPSTANHNITKQGKASSAVTNTPDAAIQSTSAEDLDSQLKENYTFDNFIEGDSNRLARSVGEAIAKNPAKTFNPMFIYGPSGCGKTHLINAIGWSLKEQHPSMRVLYISAHLFQVQYTEAVRQNKTNDFINFYQTIDALLIDDVHELSGQTKTQNTFFHIFNHLHLNNKQIILTADRPPIDIIGLEDRLLTRFKWGLQAEIEKPTKALCRAIINHRVKQQNLQIPVNVINYIAEKVNGSVRDIEGIINSMLAYSVVYKSDITMKLADLVLPRYIKVDTTPINIDDIKKLVCKHYHITETELCSQSRRQPINLIRQTTAYLASKLTEMSNSQIGQNLGGRTHATILHSIKHVQELAEVDDNFRNDVEELTNEIKRSK
ncbi:MAG: chromosomal replication initiator protein DnaA [Bacteroidaceae bacterium]|nr:chromosomal replication initiator protein DnaA [Bacteroidaceae bacterium]